MDSGHRRSENQIQKGLTMQEIIQAFKSNIGNKLTVELANGLITLIEQRMRQEIENAKLDAENQSEDE